LFLGVNLGSMYYWFMKKPSLKISLYSTCSFDLLYSYNITCEPRVGKCVAIRVHILLIHEKTKFKNLIIQYMQFWLIILFNIMCGPRVGKCVAILAVSTPNTWDCLFNWREKRNIILMYSRYFKWVVYLWNPICLEKLCSLSTYIKFIFKLCILILDCSYK